MIYTLTLNPAIDQMISVDNFILGKTNKAQAQYQVLGGKGINASVMLKTLGCDNIALGFMGQENLIQFQTYLEQKAITSEFILVNGQVRVNLKIRSLKNNQETELDCLGFEVNHTNEQAIIALIKKTLIKDDVLIISGSVPLGVSKEIYQEIAKICSENQIIFAIDARKEYLLSTLKYQPLLIKPNLAELNEIFNTNYQFENHKEILLLAKKLLQQGAQNVLVSAGNQGSILVTKTNSYFASAVQGKLVNSVGAGDSMVAGFIATYMKSHDVKESLLMASASATSSAFSPGIGNLSLINDLKSKIKITQFE